MGTKPPLVSRVIAYGREPRYRHTLYDPVMETSIDLDSAAWFRWLATPTTRSFAYPVYDPAHGYIDGWMTVRQERRQRGGGYWVAYRRCQGQLRKVYLGATATVTQQSLETVAQTFLAASQAPRAADEPDGDS